MLDRLFIFLLSIYLALAPALASQNSLLSPATGTVSGLALTNNYNNALDSLNTCNSGTSAPTNQLSGTPSLGNCWLNSTAIPYPVNYYDGADWIAPFAIDATNHIVDAQIGGGTATVASASTTDLCSVRQAALTISGTTTITSFGSTCAAGVMKTVTFSGILTLTYNGTSLIIPGAANVVTAAGDAAWVQSLGGGDWQVLSYAPASGQALLNPALDVGAVEWTFSPNIPSSKYLWAYGQAVSRSTYSVLLTALTITQSVTATSGSPTLTGFSDTTQIATGAAVEGSFVPSGATVVSTTSTTVTMSGNATASTSGNVTIFDYGNGNGTTTFGLPDCRGAVFAGRDNMGGTPKAALTSTYFGTNPDALGAVGGAQDVALSSTNQLPKFTPSGSISNVVSGGIYGGSTTGDLNGGAFSAPTQLSLVTVSSTFTGNPIGSSSPTPFATVPPTITVNCMIRALARLDAPTGAPMAAANDNQFAAILPSPKRSRFGFAQAGDNAALPVAIANRRRLAA